MNPYYNRKNFNPHTVAQAEDVSSELAAIEAAFAKLPVPTAIPAGGGAPNYLHLAFADSVDGTANFTTGPSNNHDYLGLAPNQPSPVKSERPQDYVWVRIKGSDGAAGTNGQSAEYTDERFIRSLQPPAPASGNEPTGTSVSPPDGSDPLWKTTARRNGNGDLLTAWSPWERISALPPPEVYDPTRTYYEGMQTLYRGGTYILTVPSSTGIAPTGTAQPNGNWEVIAAPGGTAEPPTPPTTFTETFLIPSSNEGVNLRSIADAAGYTGHGNVSLVFRVANGVVIQGAPGAGKAIDTGTWPSAEYGIDLTIEIANGGTVMGGGGVGGRGGSGRAGSAGGAGGDAIFQRVNLTRVVVASGGILRGGGGGGGGGGGSYAYRGGEPEGSAGGGGGGGRPNGPGGLGGVTYGFGLEAEAGTSATADSSGQGGRGASDGPAVGYTGANGADYGLNGPPSSGAAAGGAGGYAIRRNGFASPLFNDGTVAGAVG